MRGNIIYRKAIPLIDDEEILSVYNQAHGRNLSVEWFKWYNYSCPYGANRLYVAEEKSKIIAAWGMLPLKVKLNDRIVTASFASDATTHPAYQHKGVFANLNKFVQRCEIEEHGVEISIGVFGEGDIWGMKHLGWEILGDLDFVVCHSPSIDFKIPPVVKLNRFTEEFDSLLLRLFNSIKFGIVKDHKFLNWRYFDRPDKEYHTYAYRHKDEILGFITLKYFVDDNGYKKAHILDIYFVNRDAFIVLVNLAKAFSIAGNCHELDCWQPKQSPYLDWFYRHQFEPSNHKNTLKSNIGPVKHLPHQDWWIMLGDYDVY